MSTEERSDIERSKNEKKREREAESTKSVYVRERESGFLIRGGRSSNGFYKCWRLLFLGVCWDLLGFFALFLSKLRLFGPPSSYLFVAVCLLMDPGYLW